MIEGAVRVASGPWEVEEGWWTETPARREYWDVEIDGGGVYRIYRDRHMRAVVSRRHLRLMVARPDNELY